MIPQIQPDVPIPQTIPQNQPDISVPPVTIAAKPPAPSHVVSFLVRPRAFRASSHRSSPDVQSPFSTGTNPAHNTTPVDDSPVTPAMQEAPPVPATQSRVESPSYVPMAVDTVAVQSHSQTSTSNSPENETRPSLPPQRIPLPGERRRAQASGKSTLVERSRAVSTDSGAKIEVDVEMQANTPKTPEEQEIRVVGVAPTAMGSLRPGSGVLRGHSEDENRNDGQSASPPQQAQEEEESEEESEDDEMQDAPQKPETENIHLANRVEDIATDDLELDGDLELLYPDHAVSPVDNWGSASQAGRETSSGSNSASPSISPVLPPLSSARFPAAADGMTTSTELTVYPHAYAGQELEATDPGIVTRFLQSCGMLGDEMRALRAEVAQLRTERAAPEIQLEERVRRLEEREAPVARPSEPSGLGGRRWSHPLQHLISTEDLEMDVDVVVSPQADGTNIMTKYGSVDGGEPLPPRSRKFNSTPRFTGM
ncbi:hypothetical protein B0H19DRAFT_93112 [Mycena capillaripes]|nr:hypothetical protein B0H19DRAFT_93112 [Mycena capillaripes]